MSASQYECFNRSNGDYVCIFSDDDFIEPNGIELIISNISSKYNLYAFNYKSVSPYDVAIGPIESRKFNYGYELMNFHSVGHMSGLVYKRSSVLKEVDNLLSIFPLKYFNHTRGIFGCAFCFGRKNFTFIL